MPAIAIGFHLKNERPLAGPAMRQRLGTGGADGQNIHSVYLLAGYPVSRTAISE